jgi:CRP-like cAMP-binding protein
LEDCEITLIPKSEFFKLIHQNRQVSQKFIKMLSDNIKENEDQLLKLAYNSVRKRVSECLIKFFDQNEDKKTNNGLKISREDLSNMAGTSIETAIRTLSDFKDEKLIEISSGKIKILDLEKLRRLKN